MQILGPTRSAGIKSDWCQSLLHRLENKPAFLFNGEWRGLGETLLFTTPWDLLQPLKPRAYPRPPNSQTTSEATVGLEETMLRNRPCGNTLHLPARGPLQGPQPGAEPGTCVPVLHRTPRSPGWTSASPRRPLPGLMWKAPQTPWFLMLLATAPTVFL